MSALHTFTKLAGEFSEPSVLEAFAREQLSPRRWSNGAGDRYAAHSHTYHKVLYCLGGSVVFQMTESGEDVELFPGDRLDIPPRVTHSATVGAQGVVCIEAARG